jgi:hypothetical protein
VRKEGNEGGGREEEKGVGREEEGEKLICLHRVISLFFFFLSDGYKPNLA